MQRIWQHSIKLCLVYITIAQFQCTKFFFIMYSKSRMHFSHNPMHYLHIESHCNLYHVDDPLKKSFDATPNTSGILLFCLGISEARVKNLQRNIRHIFLSSDVVGAFKFQFRMRGSSQRSGQLGFFSKRLKSPFVSFM